MHPRARRALAHPRARRLRVAVVVFGALAMLGSVLGVAQRGDAAGGPAVYAFAPASVTVTYTDDSVAGGTQKLKLWNGSEYADDRSQPIDSAATEVTFDVGSPSGPWQLETDDAGGNVLDTRTFTVQDPPHITSIGISGSSLRIQGTGASIVGATVLVSLVSAPNGVATGQQTCASPATVEGNNGLNIGTWTCDLPMVLDTGDYVFEAVQQDATGGMSAFSAPVTYAHDLTVQVDTSATIYPGSGLTWTGVHDLGSSLGWSLVPAFGDSEGSTIDPSCADTTEGVNPASYSCTLDPSQMPDPGDYRIVGAMSAVETQPVDVWSGTFTIAWPATIAVRTPVGSGEVVHVVGTKLAAGQMSAFRLDGDLIDPAPCTGIVGSATSWTCEWSPSPALATGVHTLMAVFTDDGEKSTTVRTSFLVEPAGVGYAAGPGSLTITGIPLDDGTPLGSGGDVIQLDSWTPGDSEGAGFGTLARCVLPGDGEGDDVIATVSDDATTASCTFPVGTGVVNPYLVVGEGSALIDSYFVFPAAPSFTTSGAPDGTGRIAGSGAPGDTIQLTVDDAHVCAGLKVAAGGTWSCAVSGLTTGSHAVQAVEENLDNPLTCSGSGSNTCPADQDGSIIYRSGGRSPATAGSIGIPAPPAQPGGTLTTPTWTFSVGGIDPSNMHPGDTFTASGTGLPPGATVTFVLHSTPVTLGQTVVQPDGSFTFQGTIPLDTEPGAHQILATLSGVGLVSTTNAKDVTVTTAVPASQDQQDNAQQSDGGSASGSGDKHDIGLQPDVAPNVLTDGLHSIGDVLAHPQKVPAAVAIGLVLLLLGVIPAHLLNATLAEQYERIGRRIPALGRRPRWWDRLTAWLRRAPALGGLVITTLTAVLFCFADPRFGFNLESLRLIIALAVALFLVTYVVDAVTSLIVRRAWGVAVTVNLRPLGLVLSLAAVVVSRLLHFSPGFLVGLVLGLSIAGGAAGRYAWRAILIRSALVVGIAVAAWVGFSAFSHQGAEHDFTTALLLELLVAIVTEGIVALLVELLPFHLLEGERLFQRSKVLWGAVYLLAIVIFVIAVVPWEGNWAELGSGLWTWLGILGGFCVLALAVYFFFRVRSRDEHEVEEDLVEGQQVPIGED